ncbi:oxygen-independent coproporphyrinogen III oxidase [Pseudomethylobacillus aquaticus]|uniref:Coproporphyrinogen-III oxidase n=1 Tax=Pseudomethylobacillus aquaticus TaxID=2676064 RepID=A0A3N0V686_9PROT|nr:oxygen-independent coproporphyrinogen III oxidase [Pseudomethylobacillus aquaticus]ROH88101.1 oxygen-independent coproporphyrinogen III oxidase [Pseudomethylobacillus aquaticus]
MLNHQAHAMTSTPSSSRPNVSIPAAMLQRFDISGPRYTSYPTADRFNDGFDQQDYLQALYQRVLPQQPLSIYVHVPFCANLCFYCACNKIITRRHERASEYLRYLIREMALHAVHLHTQPDGRQAAVTQLHLGGGSPTYFNDAELARLMAALRHHFGVMDDAELAIEVDPRTVDSARLVRLRELGFNRLSIGVQDFDAEVQVEVNRRQSTQQVFELVAQARQLGFHGINVDLIYGLPRQTPASFMQTLKTLLQLRPDRIALYAYAHLPERFKPQQQIDSASLPAGPDKLQMLAMAIERLQVAGYDYIGMDHFALPDDALAVARRQGRLYRNFQGYTTRQEGDLIALGVSSIAKVGATYSQNEKTLTRYYEALERGHLPIARGLQLTRDDLLRRAVIMAIMCQGRVEFESIEAAHLIEFNTYFAVELAALSELVNEGIIELDTRSLQVTALGWYFVRGIAMHFDHYLRGTRTQARYSRIV